MKIFENATSGIPNNEYTSRIAEMYKVISYQFTVIRPHAIGEALSIKSFLLSSGYPVTKN